MAYNQLRQSVRRYNQNNIQQRIERFEIEQKQCIWYIYTGLKGFALIRAKRNPLSFVPDSFRNHPNIHNIKIELIGIPFYPSNTI